MPTSATVSDRIARIAVKVRNRGIRFNAPLSEDQVRRFEQRHEITLPEGFRTFLLRIGNGGVGPPAHGLAALGKPARDMRGEEARLWSQLPRVGEPFPFTSPWVWESGEVSDEGSADQILDGSLYLGTDGCGMNWHVIVTGPERGSIWMICGEGMQPTSPKRDFLQWYEDWLDGVRDWWA